MEPFSHRVIKNYELQERVGAGGFGAVYRAYQPSVGRDVAIKVILPERASHLDFIRRFEVEAQLIARLEHPHIVPLYDYWRDPMGAFLVMRWLPANLRQAILHSPWSVEAAARLLEQIAGALTVAHREGIIHRDIKPDNILLDEDQNAYLADFGVAKDLAGAELTGEGLLVGSPAYLTPEQIRGEPVTTRTDIYSLGLVIYEVLVGDRPYPLATPAELITKHLMDPLPSLTHRRANLPAVLNEVLQTATAKEPDQRYVSALRFAAAFRAAVPNLQRGPAQPLAEALTEREMDILSLMLDGLSNKEIAARLHLSGSTVRWYVQQIYTKLDAHSRHQAIERARALGLIAAAGTTSPVENLSAASVDKAVKSDVGDVSSSTIPDAVNPYKGLRAFQEADAPDFFGRAALTQQLLAHLADATGETRFLALIGPSGSGKSSLVRAGLIPALRQGGLPGSAHWLISEMLPGTHPFEELEAALLRVSAQPFPGLLAQLVQDRRGLVRAAKRLLPADPDTELVLVIDQFEELFIMVDDAQARQRFIDNLLSAVTDGRSRIRIVFTLRADFYDRPLVYPRLAELMRNHTEVIVPLTEQELERAIAGPAERSGLALEQGLVATMIGDIGQQPGTLPLLQYALTELFERRQGATLSLAAYREMGGIAGALARRADDLYAGLDCDGQTVARQLLLRLVTPGEGTEDTRRRAAQAELFATAGEERLTEEVLNLFAQYRLLTLDRDPVTRSPTAEIAHEALIRSWGRLRDWLAESREELRLQRRFTGAVTEWLNTNQDPGFLLSGSRLTQFEAWAQHTALTFTANEQGYLQASLADRDARRAVDETRKEREARIARQAQNFGRAAAVLALVGLLAVIATLLAISQASEARTQVVAANAQVTAAGLAAGQTLTPVPATLTAVAQRVDVGEKQIESLALVSAASGIAQADGNAETAALLDIRALKITYTAQADAALVQATGRLYTRQLFSGHTGWLTSIAVSPDGKTVLTGSGDRTARLWDVQTGQMLRTLAGHSNEVRSVAVSPDGKTVLTGSGDRTARLWDAQTGQVLRTLSDAGFDNTGNYGAVNSVAFSPDGKSILTGSEYGTARLWDVQTGQMLRTLVGHTDGVTSVAVSPDGRTVLTGSRDRTARLWDVQTGLVLHIFIGHTSAINSVAFSPDGQTILSGGADHTARLWNVATGQMLRTLAEDNGFHDALLYSNGVTSVAYSPSGKTILVGGDDNIARLWDVQTGQVLRTLAGHTSSVTGVAFSPDGTSALTASLDQSARMWDIQVGQSLRTLVGHTSGINSVAFSPDSKIALTGSTDMTARLWDVQSGQLQHSIAAAFDYPEGISVSSVAYAPDGKTALTGTAGGTARLWDMQTGKLLHMLSHPGSDGSYYAGVTSVAFAPDGKTALTGSIIGTARLWDVQTGQLLRTLAGSSAKKNGLHSVAFSPDSKTVLTGSSDGAARLWDAQTGQLLRTLAVPVSDKGGLNGVAFAPDGKTILTGSEDQTARLWDAQTGQLLRTLAGHTNAVTSVAFSPDGRTILTGSADQTARLWDVQTGQLLRTLAGHTNSVTSVAFSPDGKTILTGSADGMARVWDADYHDFVTFACSHVFRDFTEDERKQLGITDHEATCPHFGSQASYVAMPAATPVVLPSATPSEMQPSGPTQANPTATSLLAPIVIQAGTPHYSVTLTPLYQGAELPAGTPVSYDDFCPGGLAHPYPNAVALALSPDGALLASGDAAGPLKVWDARSGRLLLSWPGHQGGGGVGGLAFSPDSKLLAAGDMGGTVTLWNPRTGEPVRTLVGHLKSTWTLAFSVDGHLLAASDENGTIAVWDMASVQVVKTLEARSAVGRVTFSPDGARLASASADSTVRVWDIKTGQLLMSLAGHSGTVSAIAFSPNGTQLASGDEKGVLRVWDASSGKLMFSQAVHTAFILSLAYTPDGATLLSAGRDSTIGVGDAATGQLRHRWLIMSEMHSYTTWTQGFQRVVSFSADGQILASTDLGTIILRDIAIGQIRPVCFQDPAIPTATS